MESDSDLIKLYFSSSVSGIRSIFSFKLTKDGGEIEDTDIFLGFIPETEELLFYKKTPVYGE